MKILVVLFAICALTSGTTDDVSNCPKICPLIYAPICGFDGEHYKLFGNECMMKSDNCLDNHHYNVFEGADEITCEKFNCRQVCPRMYAPVCGFDGRTFKRFDNLCLMESENCLDHSSFQVVDDSVCESKKECPTVCPAIYAPVCGFDGENYKTFDNDCVMKVEACLDNHHTYSVVDMSLCTGPKEKEACPLICPEIYAPVCGFDGENYNIFDNDCYLNAKNCLNNQHYHKMDSMDLCLKKSVSTGKQCPQVCPLIFAPVCGFDGFKYQIFDNDCLLETENCMNPKKFEKVENLHSCLLRTEPEKIDCPKVCPLIYHPVCGFDGQNYELFDNDCLLNAKNCLDNQHFEKVENLHSCLLRTEPEEIDCPKVCPLIYHPVCGFDGQNYELFDNDCLLNAKNCLDNQHFEKVENLHSCLLRTEPEEIDCPKVCPLIYHPVCGFDGQNYELFDNDCYLNAKNCLDNQHFEKVENLHSCLLRTEPEEIDCPKVCPLIYHPVCGFDGQNYELFDNDCYLNAKNCLDNQHFEKVENLHSCLLRTEPEEIDCPKVCPLIYHPVCGFDGENYKLFDNDCYLEADNCLDNHHYKQVDNMKKCFAKNALRDASCPDRCPLLYLPVCGSDGENHSVFANPCYLTLHNCNDNLHYEMVEMSVCNQL